jgi:hypothetical protein
VVHSRASWPVVGSKTSARLAVLDDDVLASVPGARGGLPMGSRTWASVVPAGTAARMSSTTVGDECEKTCVAPSERRRAKLRGDDVAMTVLMPAATAIWMAKSPTLAGRGGC